jgi:hypothetical protein
MNYCQQCIKRIKTRHILTVVANKKLEPVPTSSSQMFHQI